MPRLSNERHELYALHRAKGMKPAQAVIAAGFRSGTGLQTKLEEDKEVQDRIEELFLDIREKKEHMRLAARESAKVVGEQAGVGKAWVIRQLAEIVLLANSDGDFPTSIAAIKLIGDEFGMFKGASGVKDDNDAIGQTIDLDVTEALLDQADEAMPRVSLPEPDVDYESIQTLIAGNKVATRDRILSTGSETDQTLMPEVEVPETEE